MLPVDDYYSPYLDMGVFYGSVKFSDGRSLSLGDKNILSDSIVFTENCCNRNFGFGAFLSAQLDMTLILSTLDPLLFQNAELELSRKYYGTGETSAVELRADIPFGHFYIDNATVKRSKTSISFTAYDASVFFDRIVDKNAENELKSAAPYEIISYACGRIKTEVKHTVEMAQTAEEIAGFPNADCKFAWKHSSEERLTYRQMVCAALQIMGAWGRINRYGKFEIRKFDMEPVGHNTFGGIVPNNTISRSISDFPAQITGVCYGDLVASDETQLYDLSENLIISDSLNSTPENIITALANAENVMGLQIYSADISWFGDPALEAGDCIFYGYDETQAEDLIKIIVMENRWTPHGACTIRSYSIDTDTGRVSSSVGQSSTTNYIKSGSLDASYIKEQIVLPEVNSLESFVTGDILGGLTFESMTVEEFEKLEVKDPNRIYTVRQKNGELWAYQGNDRIVITGGSGEAVTIEHASLVDSSWTANHEMIPIAQTAGIPAYYGGNASRFVIQGNVAVFGKEYDPDSSNPITIDDISSDFKFYNGTPETATHYCKAWCYVSSVSQDSVAVTGRVGTYRVEDDAAVSSGLNVSTSPIGWRYYNTTFTATFRITPEEYRGFTCGLCILTNNVTKSYNSQYGWYGDIASSVRVTYPPDKTASADDYIFSWCPIVAFVNGVLRKPILVNTGFSYQTGLTGARFFDNNELMFALGLTKRYEPEPVES